MSLNRVTLIGRLTRDPELRQTTSGKNVTSFSIAVNRTFASADGTDVDFFNITAWGKTAEFCSNYLAKGRLVAVDGRLQARKYTAQDGSNREVVEVVAESVQGLDRPRDEQGGAPAGKPEPVSEDDEAFDPFGDE